MGRVERDVRRHVVARLVLNLLPALGKRLWRQLRVGDPLRLSEEDARDAPAAGGLDLARHRAGLVREEGDDRRDELWVQAREHVVLLASGVLVHV